MKINVTIWLALFLNITTFSTYGYFERQDGSVNISHIEAVPGEVVMVPVIANGLQNISTLRFTIQFNGDVLSKIDNTPVVTNIFQTIGSLGQNVTNDSTLVINWFSPFAPATIPNNTKLFDLRFQFCNDLFDCAENGTQSPLKFIAPTQVTRFEGGSFIVLDIEYTNGSVFADPPLRLLELIVEGQGDVLVDGEEYTLPVVADDDSLLEVIAIPEENWNFIGWFEDDNLLSDALSYSVLMNDNRTIHALFEEEVIEEPLPENLALNDVTVEGEACFNALQTIILSGNNSFFHVLPEAHVTMIAGENIIMLDGTHIMEGSTFHAYITTDDEFCALPIADAEPYHDEEQTAMSPAPVHKKDGLFRVFPNPARESVTLELQQIDHQQEVTIHIFSIYGETVYESRLSAEPTYTLNFANYNPGIYLIRVFHDDRTEVQRVIKQ